MRKGIMALENLDEPVEAEITDFVDAPENDLADAAESESALSEVNDGIEEAAETGETLEGIHEAMGESLESGGMPEPEARALEVAVEHMCARVGFSKRRKVFPAMEGFKEKGSDRIRSTKLAMEEIGAKIKAIGEAIIKAFWTVVDHIKTFFKSLVDGAIGLKKRAEALEAKAKATKSGHGPDGKKVSTSGFGNLLSVDGKFPEGSTLVAAYQKHITDAFVTADRSGVIAKATPIIDTMIKEDKLDEEEIDKLNQVVESSFTGMEKTSKEGTDDNVMGYKLTFGGAEFILIKSETGPKVAIRTVGDKPEVSDKAEALVSTDAAKLAGMVAKHLGTYAGSASKIGESINKLAAQITKIKDGKAKDVNSVKAIGIAVRSLNQAVNQSAVILKSYDVKVAKAALNYVGASLGGLKQEKAAAAAK